MPGEPSVSITETTCEFGAAKNGECLKPCESVVVDLDAKDANGRPLNRVGDILYFKDLAGVKCSDGEKNLRGEFIVVDHPQREKIRGTNQVRLFIGDCENGS